MTVVEAIVPEQTLGIVLNTLSGYSLPLSIKLELLKLESKPTVNWACIDQLYVDMRALRISDAQYARCIKGGGNYRMDMLLKFRLYLRLSLTRCIIGERSCCS
jgi:hypothetical protein